MKDFQGHNTLGKKAQGQDTTNVKNTNQGFFTFLKSPFPSSNHVSIFNFTSLITRGQ